MVNVVVFAYGDDEIPNASPSMTIFANDSMQVTDSYEGSAPVKATFNSNASDYGGYTPIYEWRFFNSENSETPFLVRYDANTEYTFNESGSFTIQLCISFVNGEDTVEYLQESPFTISISTSKLEIPNAFSPNGDGQNDVFKVKEGLCDNLKSEYEGYHEYNFYGTFVIGPLLIRNPHFTNKLVKEIMEKNNLIYHEYEDKILVEAYNEYFKNFY